MKRVNQRTLSLYASFLKLRSSSLSSTCRYSGGTFPSSRIISYSNFRLFSNHTVCLSKPLVSKEVVADTSTGTFSDGHNATDSVDKSNEGVKLSVSDRIGKATDAESLLEMSVRPDLVLKHHSLILFNLGQLVMNKRARADTILKDKRFSLICSVLQGGHYEQNPNDLLLAIQGLVSMGVPNDNHTLQVLQNELKWIVRRCPIRFVCRAVSVLSNVHGDELNVKKASPANTKLDSSHPLIVAVTSLQRRWIEVMNGTDFISAFQVSSFLSKDICSKLEDRATELVQEFSQMEMIKIIIALGNQKRRPTPLLRAMAFHLSKNKGAVEPKDLIEVLYALNSLSFADPVLVAKVCNDLSPEIVAINNSALVSSLVTSLGQMRYKHNELSAALENWIMKHLDTLRPFDYAAWLLTSSVLNLQSEYTETFCRQAKQVLSENRPSNPEKWLSIVHALVTLNHVDSSLISSVLASEFVSQIDASGIKASGAKLKLLNLNSAIKSIQNYSGPRLPEEIVKDWTSTVTSSDETISQSVFETLRNFLPPPKYLKSGEKHASGVYVDAFCKLNEKLDPIPVDTVPSRPSDKDKVINVAVVTQGYLTHTLGVKEPTGLAALQTKLLQNEGFQVISVPYMEFSPKEKIARRVLYLERKMRSINIPSNPESP